ncbi:MAG TPA: M15 family metallopeptidase [Acidimicrobiales bacterium]|jgi:hypothetical protein|nr:M15 family metallopeptidase [Acidimicrobiales bacterium]
MSRPMPPTTPRLARFAIAMLAAATLVSAGANAVSAQEAPTPPPTPDEARQQEEQRRLSEQLAQTQAALDSHAKILRAEASQVRAEALRLRGAVAAQQAVLAEARAAADAAIEQLAAARDARAQAEADVVEQRTRTKKLAASAYMNGPASINLILKSKDINDAVRRQSMAAAAGQATAETLAALDKAEKLATRAERHATEAAQIAAAAAASAESEAQALADQQARQSLILSAVNDRIEHTLSEAAALASIDPAAADAAAQRDAVLRDIAMPSVRPITSLRPSIPRVPTTRVGGITVSVAIAPQLQALLDAAAAAGFNLGGGGFRDPSAQIALRVLHCGPTDYDIYEKPAGECVPPTARPGMSMHEHGLAIDFTVNGRALVSESDPAFQWLAANAATYGFYNLPGEPWHWSTTGT